MSNSEVFRWHYYQLDVSRLLADIQAGLIPIMGIHLDRGDIESYAKAVLHFHDAEPSSRQEWQLPINLNYVRSLSEERLQQPLLLVHFGEGGLIAVEDEGPDASYVLADGNNRLARAYMDGTPTLICWIVGRDQAKPYWSPLHEY